MFWQEDRKSEDYQVPDDVQDLHFDIQCRELPVDHIHSLSLSLVDALPWIEQVPRLGIHEIYLAGSQNGWQKPDPELGQTLVLSRRTKLVIRAPKEHMDRLQEEILDVTLDIEGYKMTVGKAKAKLLSKSETIYARHMVMEAGEAEDENLFLKRMSVTLAKMGARPQKALCGKSTEIKTDSGSLYTRSLMLADLSPKDSVELQMNGIGCHQLVGCGIFLPMKGIQALPLDSD